MRNLWTKGIGFWLALVLCACAANVSRGEEKTIYLKKFAPGPQEYSPSYRVSDKIVQAHLKQGNTLNFEISPAELKQLYPAYSPAWDAPLVGVLFNREKEAYSIPGGYLYPLLKAGARVRVLFFEELEKQVEALDGIVLTGGDFAWPTDMYFELENKEYPPVTNRYKAYEFLAMYAAKRHMPLLGICAGMQAMSYVLTNHQVKLHEYLSAVTSVNHRSIPPKEMAHLITLNPESRLAKILGSSSISVNSRHFQGVAESTLQQAKGIKAVAYSPDGVVEALEFEGYPNALSVQFHPEVMAWIGNPNGQLIFDAFVQDAQIYKQTRSPLR